MLRKLDNFYNTWIITHGSLKWIKDVNVRPEITELLENNAGSKLFDTSLGDEFLDLTPKAEVTKSKTEVILHQTKQLLQSKGNHQQRKKVIYSMGENMCKSYI